jgi:hypothetical protein
LKVPADDGVPDRVTTLAAQLPVTPIGSPEYVAPVAPVVGSEIDVIGDPRQTVWLVPVAIVFCGFTVIVPVAVTTEQPPVEVTV